MYMICMYACIMCTYTYTEYAQESPSSLQDPRFRFPTVTSTTSPIHVLPQYVDVLGRKLDKCQIEMDRYCHTC